MWKVTANKHDNGGHRKAVKMLMLRQGDGKWAGGTRGYELPRGQRRSPGRQRISVLSKCHRMPFVEMFQT